MLQAGRSRVRFPMRSLDFFNLPNPSSRTMALGSTKPLTEMSARNLPGGKGRPACKADNLTAICEPTVWKIWEPRCLTTVWAFTVCYRDSFTFLHFGICCLKIIVTWQQPIPRALGSLSFHMAHFRNTDSFFFFCTLRTKWTRPLSPPVYFIPDCSTTLISALN
jgi:hypothetical protein